MNMRKYYIGLLENDLGLPKYSIYKLDFQEGTNETVFKLFLTLLYDTVGVVAGAYRRKKVDKQILVDLVNLFRFTTDLVAAPLATPFIPKNKKWRKYTSARLRERGFS